MAALRWVGSSSRTWRWCSRVLLPALAGALGGDAQGVAASFAGGSLVAAALLTLAKVTMFVALVVLVGTRVVPWLLLMVARTVVRRCAPAIYSHSY
jgi:predicted Kef-type K+ transport protein